MKKFSFFLLLITLIYSCREDVDIIDPPTGPDPQIIVNSSVYGIVTDEDGSAVSDALVSFNTLSTMTDEHGFFTFNNEDLYQDGTFITVAKEGYMHGSRMFYPRVNDHSNISIQLIEKNIVGTISSSSGGKVEFNGASIDIPADGIMMEDGSAYTGNVNVIAKWLDPTDVNTVKEMPGDLVGINSESEQQALATYGMLGVELEDQNGNALQIKDGSTAAIQVPVTQELMSSAPSEIPLWHFDEETGYWIEEGKATLVNGNYEGEVSHFSFWNCDYPFPLICLDGIINLNGFGAPGLNIEILDNSTGFGGYGTTSNRGYFAGKVPQDQSLTLNILDDCGEVIYSENIGSFATDATLPVINVTNVATAITLSGTVTNCNGDMIDEGYVWISFENDVSIYTPINDDDTFEVTLTNCSATEATIVAVDQTNDVISSPLLVSFAGNLNIDLEACDSYYEASGIIEYVGSPFLDNQFCMATVENQIFPDKVIRNISVINWQTGFVHQFSVVVLDGEVTAAYTIDFDYDGFNCSGTADVFMSIDESGKEVLIFKSTTTNITVTDASIFDPAITQVVFDLVM